jgi:hypothetical protein
MLKTDNFIGVILAILVSALAWKFTPCLELSQVQYIASTMSTVSGILFGFVMASITILATAKDNKLVQNTAKTQYLPKLVSKLNCVMVFLLLVCVVFLSSLFIKIDNIAYGEIKLVSIIIEIGVFIFSLAVYKFIRVWREFSKFASHM